MLRFFASVAEVSKWEEGKHPGGPKPAACGQKARVTCTDSSNHASAKIASEQREACVRMGWRWTMLEPSELGGGDKRTCT